MAICFHISPYVNFLVHLGLRIVLVFAIFLTILETTQRFKHHPDMKTFIPSQKEMGDVEKRFFFSTAQNCTKNLSLTIFNSTVVNETLFHCCIRNSKIRSINTDYGRFHYDVNKIAFGMTTNADRVFFIVNYLKFWATLPGINCRLFFPQSEAWLLPGIKQFLKSNNIFCFVDITQVKTYTDRLFDIIKQMWDQSYNSTTNLPNSEWYVLHDDDTMWFMDNLLTILKLHNSSKEIYLGAHSDNVGQVKRHGSYFAYGGGGVILSKSLIARIVRDMAATEKYKGAGFWDVMIGDYIVKGLNVSLVNDMRFHQMDIYGDGSGYIESGIDGLATLHHMLSWWQPFPVWHMKDPDEIVKILHSSYSNLGELYLRRYVWIDYFNRQTILLTMGYSIAVFNRTLTEKELNQVERTYDAAILFKEARPREKAKESYFLRRVTSEKTKNERMATFVYESAKETRSKMEVIVTF